MILVNPVSLRRMKCHHFSGAAIVFFYISSTFNFFSWKVVSESLKSSISTTAQEQQDSSRTTVSQTAPQYT